MTKKPSGHPVNTMADALARIAELEAGLDEAMTLLVQRDARLAFYERRIFDLEAQIDIENEAKPDEAEQ